MYFDESDLIEMARRDREDEERAQEAKALRDRMLTSAGTFRFATCTCECSRGQFCGGCGHAGCGRR